MKYSSKLFALVLVSRFLFLTTNIFNATYCHSSSVADFSKTHYTGLGLLVLTLSNMMWPWIEQNCANRKKYSILPFTKIVKSRSFCFICTKSVDRVDLLHKNDSIEKTSKLENLKIPWKRFSATNSIRAIEEILIENRGLSTYLHFGRFRNRLMLVLSVKRLLCSRTFIVCPTTHAVIYLFEHKTITFRS